jgi:hypothetical protein
MNRIPKGESLMKSTKTAHGKRKRKKKLISAIKAVLRSQQENQMLQRKNKRIEL